MSDLSSAALMVLVTWFGNLYAHLMVSYKLTLAPTGAKWMSVCLGGIKYLTTLGLTSCQRLSVYVCMFNI